MSFLSKIVSLSRPFPFILFVAMIGALALGTTSCGMFGNKRSAAYVQKKMSRKERRKTSKLVREYDKMYKQQTKIQAKEQRKRIKKSRRKPTMMLKRK